MASEIVAVLDGLNHQWIRSNYELDIVGVFDAYIERMIVTIDAKG